MVPMLFTVTASSAFALERKLLPPAHMADERNTLDTPPERYQDEFAYHVMCECILCFKSDKVFTKCSGGLGSSDLLHQLLLLVHASTTEHVRP